MKFQILLVRTATGSFESKVLMDLFYKISFGSVNNQQIFDMGEDWRFHIQIYSKLHDCDSFYAKSDVYQGPLTHFRQVLHSI